jgi:putative aldouronate transport system substrate-binding protein
MERRMKRFVLFLSLVSLILSAAVINAAAKKPAKLTAMIDIIQRAPDGQDEWIAEYKNLTGIELEAVVPPHNEYSQKLKILFASGDVPDIIEVPAGDYANYAVQGALCPIDSFIAKSALMKNVDKRYLEASKIKGKTYGFPLNPGSGCVAYVRKDWLDKYGFKVPATWEELYTVMQAFTAKDPDGNGKNDTYGYTTSLDVPISEFDFYNRMIMIDAKFDFTQLKNGKWVDGFTEKSMVSALERFRKLYKEGIIDQEFFTNKTSTARSKFTDGKVGIYEYWSGLWAYRMDDGVKQLNPNGVVIPIDPVKGGRYIARMGPMFGIYYKSKNPEAAFKYWDELQVDKGAGQMFFTYGVKGITYDVVDGKVKLLPKKSNPKETFEKMYVEPAFTTNDWVLPVSLDARMTKSRDVHKANSDLLGYIIGGENYVKYSGEIWKLKQQIFAKIVIGEMTVADGMKQYNEKAKSLKIATMIAEINANSKK